jgi:hypothetical protein
MTRKLLIVDVESDGPAKFFPTKENTPPLSEEFGRNLDTIAKARQWLTNPHNWLDQNSFVVKWDGLIVKIAKHHGVRLFEETHDNGLPEVVVREQIRLRRGGRREEEFSSGGDE